MSRPTNYTPEIATEICRRIEEGESIRDICEEDGMPSWPTIRSWKLKHPEFLTQYAQAYRESAFSMEEEILRISRTAKDKDSASAARVQIDTIKWLMSKRDKGKYSDRLDLNHSGEITTRQLSDDQLIEKLNAIIGQPQGI